MSSTTKTAIIGAGYIADWYAEAIAAAPGADLAAVVDTNLGAAEALAEVATLPEEARADLSDWTARAETRAAALDAAASLDSDLNDS